MNYEFPQSTPENSHQSMSLDELIELTKVEAPPLTPEQTEALTRLDKRALKDTNIMIDMPDITGVLANVKPSAYIYSSKEMEQFAGTMGLVYCQSTSPEYATISRSDELANELVKTFESVCVSSKEVAEKNRKIGKLLGYPETATAYFVERMESMQNSFSDELPYVMPEGLEGTIHREFVRLNLSPDHWREELEEYVLPLETSVYELAPLTYRAHEKKARKARTSRKMSAIAIG